MTANQRSEGIHVLPIPRDEEPEDRQSAEPARPLELAPVIERERSRELESRVRELEGLARATCNVNQSLRLDEVLERMYESLASLLPYDRMSVALVEDGGERVRTHWVRAWESTVLLCRGYSEPLRGHSLERVLANGTPRVIDDLSDYLRKHPTSNATRMVVAEGMRSSLTCPLQVDGSPIGLLFLASQKLRAYSPAHVAIARELSPQIAPIVRKAQDRERLLALNSFKDRTMGMMGHDLQNPLSVIVLNAEFLKMSGMGEQQKQCTDAIIRSARRMEQLLDRMLDAGALQAGRAKLVKEKVDLRKLLADWHEGFQVVAAVKQMGLAAHMAADLPEVWADPTRLRQVLDNLGSNAVKYSPRGSTLALRAAQFGNEVRIGVTDQGPGIPPTELGRLFCEYERGSARPTGGESSTGLGLSIAKHLVDLHHGRIWVDTTAGHGSTFWVGLPLASPAAAG